MLRSLIVQVVNSSRCTTRISSSVLYTTSVIRNASTSSKAPARKDSVGFVGLGNMGASMAANLIKAGFPLIVNDINSDAVSKLVQLGARSAATPAEVAAKASSIITMLPSSPHVRLVYSGPNGLLGASELTQQPTLFIDSSTIDPTTAREVAQSVSQASNNLAHMLDAPVSGGVNAASGGTLTFMVGGPADYLAAGRPFLEAMGKKIVHCGSSGAGQVAKVCNNLVLGISMIGVSEAMNLGVQLGIDPKVLADVFNTSSARCWSSDTYNPVPGVMPNVPASRDYEGGFQVDLMTKDLGLANDAARAANALLPLGDAALKLYKQLSFNYGKKDFSVVYKYLHNSSTKTKSGSSGSSSSSTSN